MGAPVFNRIVGGEVSADGAYPWFGQTTNSVFRNVDPKVNISVGRL